VTTDGGRRRGRFRTLEGPEGAGKSTAGARIRDHLVARGITVVVTREPGGTPVGEAIRDVLLTTQPERHPAGPRVDALLFNAARAQLVETVIQPALERGDVVVCDRYADSTLAYQGHGAGLPLPELRDLATFATGGLQPDLTILLDLPVEAGLARKAGQETRFEQAFDVDYHRRVRAGFLALAAAEPGRFAVVDATQEPDAVTRDVLAAVDRLPVPSSTAE
jgi:dTMP kinase